MANYHTTLCFIFGTPEETKKIIEQIVVPDEQKSGCLNIDFSKIVSIPENIKSFSDDEQKKWTSENIGGNYASEFYYKIYENFAEINMEGKWSVFLNLFKNLQKKFNVPVLIKYWTEGSYGSGIYYKNPKIGIELSLDSDDEIHGNPEFMYAVNWSMIGVRENLYQTSCRFENTIPIIFEGGDVFWKQRKEESLNKKYNDKIVSISDTNDEAW